jgi:hypothetical protein
LYVPPAVGAPELACRVTTEDAPLQVGLSVDACIFHPVGRVVVSAIESKFWVEAVPNAVKEIASDKVAYPTLVADQAELPPALFALTLK